LPHSQGIWYTPGTFRPKSSLTGLSMCIFFFFGMSMVLILCLTSSLLILFVMACWYGSKATPTGFSSFVCGFCFGCRARLISFFTVSAFQVLDFSSETFRVTKRSSTSY
jgi:hypothetical protein